MIALHQWLSGIMDPIVQWLLGYPELTFGTAAAIMLSVHFRHKREARGVLLLLFGILVITAGLLFIVLARRPEPVPFRHVAGMLVLYGIGLFVILSEAMLAGFAKFLTAQRGEKWVKEMDYFYLAIGAIGILASMNRIEFLTGRFEGTDILAPLVLTTAVVIRFLKTRADIAGWNKITIPTSSPSSTT
jgi:hypothetical protein